MRDDIETFREMIGPMRARFPHLFASGDPPALALGIHADISEKMGLSRSRVRVFLRVWTGSSGYLRAVAYGGGRVDVHGELVGVIEPAHRVEARGRLAGRRTVRPAPRIPVVVRKRRRVPLPARKQAHA